MLVCVDGQPQLSVGFGQLVPLYHPPHAIELVVGVDGVARVKMGEQRLASSFQRENGAAGERLVKSLKRRQAELNALGSLVLEYCLDFIGGSAYFRALGHGLGYPNTERAPLFHCLRPAAALVREASERIR